MPYIPEKGRQRFAPALRELQSQIMSDGDLNFVITSLLLTYSGGVRKYELLERLIGVLECAKLELYRRVVGPYEDTKIEENGDVEGMHPSTTAR